jgi:cupin 2 domain-containing protein
VNPVVKNLFANLPPSSAPEEFLTLAQTDHVRVERIVSNGQASLEGFRYDQPGNEWVLLLRGAATLEFADESIVYLKAGDCLLIDRHVKHRVVKTSSDAIWLAVHSI